jgi:predicted Zn finger-like uncharacterized protein
MKFACESCQAQYMISDEKVGPAGVRVRCKKCQHINLIKPVSLSPPAEAAPASSSASATPAPAQTAGEPASPASKGSNPGLAIPKDLEEEIGNALDSVFTEAPTPAPAPAAEAAPAGFASSGSQSGATPAPASQRMGGTQPGLTTSQPGVTTSVVTAAPVSAAAAEWFVAINDEQVGPLRAEDVKARWEKGEIGADTLVWCGRMPDWRPLSAVEDLARLVVPIRSQPTPLPRAAGGAATAPLPNDGEPGIGFKPSAASAMASLASLAKEEISAADRSRKISQPVKTSGSATAGMLADLPAPTDQIPASPRPVSVPEHVEEAPVPRTPRPTRESYEAGRSSGGGLKVAAVILAVALVSVGTAGAAYWFLVKPKLEEKRAPHQEDRALVAQKEAPPALAPVTPPVPAPAAAATPPPAANPPAPPAPAKEVAAAKTPAAATRTATPKAPPPPAEDRRHRRDRAHPGAPEDHPQRTIAAAVGSSAAGEDFLNGAGESSLDKEFAKELEGTGEGAAKSGSKPHSVYIPPPPGQADLPQALSQSQIMETVVQHKGSFAKCVQEQKKRDASSTGTLVMRWKIRPDGHTADVVSKGGDYQDSPLAACLKNQITRMHFGGYRGPQMAPIDFPFNF